MLDPSAVTHHQPSHAKTLAAWINKEKAAQK